MTITESAVVEALKSEDIESLIEAGAPDDEYTPEAQCIVQALATIDESEISEEALAGSSVPLGHTPLVPITKWILKCECQLFGRPHIEFSLAVPDSRS